jgi:hypothetical protein
MKKIVLFLVLMNIMQECKLFRKSIFDSDIPYNNNEEAKITKESLPVPKVTKEVELEKILNGKPRKKMSFLHIREKTFEKRTILYDRIYEFVEAINRDRVDGNGRPIGYIGLERKFLTVFSLRGIVQDFTLAHSVKDEKFKDDPVTRGWGVGPLNNFKDELYFQNWPDAGRDCHAYFSQEGNPNKLSDKNANEYLDIYNRHTPPVKTRMLNLEEEKKVLKGLGIKEDNWK